MTEECKYNLGHTEFHAVYSFLVTFAVDGDMTIDEYRKKLKEIDPEESEEFLKEECSELDSIRRFGEGMYEVLKKIKLHVMICDECKAGYKDFIETQWRKNLQTAELLESIGFKNLEEDIIGPDFLGLGSDNYSIS